MSHVLTNVGKNPNLPPPPIRYGLVCKRYFKNTSRNRYRYNIYYINSNHKVYHTEKNIKII